MKKIMILILITTFAVIANGFASGAQPQPNAGPLKVYEVNRKVTDFGGFFMP